MRTMLFWKKLHGKNRQCGAVLLLVTFSLIAFLGFVALALDLGRMYIVKSQLQNAADSGALRAALALNGTRDGVWMAGRPGTDCKNVAAGGDPCGVDGALKNGHLLAADDLLDTEVTVKVANYPYDADDARWQNPGSVTGPNDYYYALVIAQKSGIKSFFAGILGIWENGAQALAIAGRYSPFGQVMPLMVPVVRRNADQVASNTECNGLIYNNEFKDNKIPLDYTSSCPSTTLPWDDPNEPKTWWRGWDESGGNWGFLRPGEIKCVNDYSGPDCTAAQKVFNSSSPTTRREVGGWYKVNLKPVDDLANEITNYSLVGKAWKGNFGYLISGEDKKFLGALCKGGVEMPQNPIPGCRDVVSGATVSHVASAFNTRFENPGETNPFKGELKDYDYDMCAPDANLKSYSEPPPSAYGQYEPPPVPSPLPPTKHGGAHGRRVINVFVVDNAWLTGYQDGSGCYGHLRGGGGKRPAHIVGCAKFFMWQPVSTEPGEQGTAYLEFIERVPNDACTAGTGPATYTEIRLFR